MTKLIENPTYDLPSGKTITLKPIPPFLIHAVVSNNHNAPKPPVVTFERKGKKVYEENPDDPKYLERLEKFEEEKNLRLLQLIFTEGIVESVDSVLEGSELENVVDLTQMVFGNEYTQRQLKYIWITTELPNESDLTDLQEAIQSLSMPTDESIEESKSSS